MKYLIGIVFAVAFASCSKTSDTINSDVSYTDLQPDVVVTDSFLMDIDKDGDKDIKLLIEKVFQGNSSSGDPTYNYYARGVALKSNVSVSAGTRYNSSQNSWNCLQFGNFISSEITWMDTLNLNANVIGKGAVGVWDVNPSYNFVGVKIDDAAKSNYGWVRLITSYDSLTVDRYEITVGEFAYMNPNNIVIRAGQIE